MATLLPFVVFDCEESVPGLPHPFCLHWELQTKGYFSLGKMRKKHGHTIFHYCLSGRGCVRYKGQVYTVLPGTGFLGVIDEIDYFYPEDGTEDWSFFWFGFCGGNYRELTHALVDQYGPIFPLPANGDFLMKLQMLKKNCTMHLNAMEGAAMIFDLLGALKRQKEKSSFLSLPHPVQKIILMVRESKMIPRISEIADTLRLSREHLSRLFQNTMKTTLQSYLEEQSNQLAKKLLLSTDLSIKEVAQQCGYQSASSFIRMFEKQNHIPPLRFRKNISRLYSSGWEQKEP